MRGLASRPFTFRLPLRVAEQNRRATWAMDPALRQGGETVGQGRREEAAGNHPIHVSGGLAGSPGKRK